MKIKELQARVILDSRKEKTIEVLVKSDFGIFSASSPSGKSKGKYERKAFIKSVEEDIEKIKNTQIKEEINEFNDLIKVENIFKGKIGANSLFALESAILKALALEQGKELWQVINEKAHKLPFPVGNCIGGGLHTKAVGFTKPDFQEFLILPRARNFSDNIFLMNKAWEIAGKILDLRKAKGGLNDESAWSTNLTNKEVLDIMNKIREQLEQETEDKIEIGVDMAASSFFTGLVYNYKNPVKRLKAEEQLRYVKELIENFRLGYVEDAFNDDDFENFAELRKEIIKERACLIVGDDLIASQLERLRKALFRRSVNAIIVKPNQTGSLIEIKKLVDACKRYEIFTVFSHRSGETLDYALADLAFGFQADFIKTGIKGRERGVKLNRLIEISKSLGF